MIDGKSANSHPNCSMRQQLRHQVLRHQTSLFLAAILLLAAGLRLYALRFSLPAAFNPDEDLLVMPAMNILKTGSFAPLRMDYGTFFIYLLVPFYTALFLLQMRDGLIGSVDELRLYEHGTFPAIFPHPEYVLVARLLVVAFGVGTVVVAFLLARRLGNARQGLLAALLVAVMPDLVLHAHFAVTDVPLSFMATLSIYLLVRVYDNWESDSLWAYAGAGFVCGLAAATKYNGALLLLPLVLVPLLKVRSLDDLLRARVLAGPLGMAAGFVAGTPYALLDLPAFVHAFGSNLRIYNRPGYYPTGSTVTWWLTYLFTHRNAPAVWLGLAGAVIGLVRWGRRGWLVHLFVFAYLLTIFGQSERQQRTWLAVAPLIAVYGGLALDTAWAWWQRRTAGQKRRRVAGAAAVLALVLVWLFVRAAEANRALATVDVRTNAQLWIEANIPPGTPLAVDRFPPNISPDLWPMTQVFALYMQDLAWYQAQGIRYLIVGDIIHDAYRLSDEDWRRYTALIDQMCLVAEIEGSWVAAPDRRIWIYEVPPCSRPG